MSIPTRQEADAMVRERLASDPDFRQHLLDDPRAALSGLVGLPLPDAVNITVHEETLTSIHLVLPAHRDLGELSEEDLDLVAGAGECWDDLGFHEGTSACGD